MSRSGLRPARRIIWRARSAILTGSPMSRTKILPREPPSSAPSSSLGGVAEASSTSSTASRTVMKNRLTSGWVTVSDPRSDAGPVAPVPEQRVTGKRGPALAQFAIDRVEQDLAVVDEDEARGCEGGDLPGQFRADRAAGAGHQDATAADQPRHGLA